MSPSKVTLTYFDLPGSRGEECRLALSIAGVPFTDERLSDAQWEARKPSAPFGALPFFTVEGHEPLAQSNAILALIGREHGLLPKDSWEAARHHAVMDAVEDLRHEMGPTADIADPAEKKRAREEKAAGYLPAWAAQVEQQIRGPFLGGADLSVADVKLFVVTGPYLRGKIDFVPTTVFDGAPKLLALAKAVKEHPAVVAWYAKK